MWPDNEGWRRYRWCCGYLCRGGLAGHVVGAANPVKSTEDAECFEIKDQVLLNARGGNREEIKASQRDPETQTPWASITKHNDRGIMGSPTNGLEKVDMGHEMQLVKGPHEVIPY